MKDLHDDSTIFSMSDHLTKEQLVQYHLGQLPKDERYTVEKHLIDCELCKDALSGMALLPGYEGINRIRKDIRRIARPEQDLMNRIAWRNVTITASVLSIVVLATLFYIYFTGTEKSISEQKSVAVHPESQAVLHNTEHDSSATVQSERNSSDSLNANAPVSPVTEKEKSSALAKTSEEHIEPIKSKPVTSLPENFKRHENLKLKKATLPFIFLADLKVLDYSIQYSSKPDMMAKFETGVLAQFKNKAEQADAEKEKAKETREATYKNFLEDALLNYKKGNCDDALDMLKLIHNSFPQDLNAMFYSGLCYYQLGRWNFASERFALSGKDPASPFYEESKWYLALTEIKQNKISEAKELLIEIITEDGFYKKQAQGKLAELK